jgi:hypothetical protein
MDGDEPEHQSDQEYFRKVGHEALVMSFAWASRTLVEASHPLYAEPDLIVDHVVAQRLKKCLLFNATFLIPTTPFFSPTIRRLTGEYEIVHTFGDNHNNRNIDSRLDHPQAPNE